MPTGTSGKYDTLTSRSVRRFNLLHRIPVPFTCSQFRTDHLEPRRSDIIMFQSHLENLVNRWPVCPTSWVSDSVGLGWCLWLFNRFLAAAAAGLGNHTSRAKDTGHWFLNLIMCDVHLGSYTHTPTSYLSKGGGELETVFILFPKWLWSSHSCTCLWAVWIPDLGLWFSFKPVWESLVELVKNTILDTLILVQ